MKYAIYNASAIFAMRGTVLEDRSGRDIIVVKHLNTTSRKTGAFETIRSSIDFHFPGTSLCEGRYQLQNFHEICRSRTEHPATKKCDDNKNGQKLWKKCKCLFLNGRCCLKDGNDKTHNQGRSQNRSTHLENLPDAPLNQCLYVKNIHVLPSLYYAKEKLLCKKIPAVDKNK